jgi:hypothetical protein
MQPVQQLPDTQRPPGHTVRLGLVMLSWQTGAPVAQEISPSQQAPGLVVQLAPGVHAMHEPVPLQTPPGHEVPAGTLPLTWHTGEPEPHAMVPV